MNKHRVFIGLTLVEMLVLGLFFSFGQTRVSAKTDSELRSQRDLVSALRLTDLAIWTEARYSRHPSQADRFTPFQDFPAALEHFPAGSIIAPPYPNPSRP